MVKKRLLDGQPCRKCVQAEALLKKRAHWDRISEVVWADEGDPQSVGMKLAEEHEVAVAPFFIVRSDDGSETVEVSTLKLIKRHLKAPQVKPEEFELAAAQAALAAAEPSQIVRSALERFGADCVIAFSGSDDVVLIDMAVKTGLPFSVLVLDTGRLHPETHQFIEEVRSHYGIEIMVASPDALRVEQLVLNKGLFSFFEEGHHECCQIRKVEPLARCLAPYRAWVTGQRRDQSAETREELQTVEVGASFDGAQEALVKFNPLANWSRERLWQYMEDNHVPHNELHDRGFASIGCAPCTRPIGPNQHEREGRWWWEDALKKECGLHANNLQREK